MTEETQTPEDSPKSEAPFTVMLLGASELSRELVTAFQRLGAVVVAVDRNADTPAHAVADRSCVVKMTDADELTALIEREEPDLVVAEAPDGAGEPVIDNDALAAVAERGLTDVVPTARSSRLRFDREGLRRLAADELGLPTAPFWFAGSAEELTAVAAHAGFPLVVRPVVGAQGEGESVLLRAEDIAPAWDRAVSAGGRVAQTRVLVETMVEIDDEVTLLTVRTAGPAGSRVHFCEPIGHRQLDGDVLESWQPQAMTPGASEAAKSIAARIVNTLGGRGVYGVELLVKGDEVYFADVSARPYDSGLVTLRSQRLSEFELHARAILGLPVDTIMITPGAAEVVYAGSQTGSADGVDESRTERATQALTDALTVPESDVRVFGHPQSYPRRRLGVALATGADVTTARDRARQVVEALRKFW
ncbi:formate-dependent phosphoribosylglycinamide formyltransferase [Mycobacterium sp.]|uniref:formate-dependent phosphoribosylglycinamide formyltransferase n=1 Tax=Mycobacterium sp. TaxID=1785 RepID=UPI0039C903BD